MKSFVSLSAALVFSTAAFSLSPSPLWAQPNADPAALIAELKGETPATMRVAAQWQADYSRALEALLPDMSSDDLGKRGVAQNTWEKIVLHATRPGAEIERVALVSSMLPKIGAATPREARIWLLKMLEWSGREEAVAPLTALLGDADAEIAERARRALANDPAPAAGAALREALNKAADTPHRVAFISALGFRKEMAGTAMLSRLASDKDEAVANQAIVSLAQIGDAGALKVLSGLTTSAKLQPILSDARLRVAAAAVSSGRGKEAAPLYLSLLKPSESRFNRMGALRGLVMVKGAAALPQLVAALSGDDDRIRAAAARDTLLIKDATATKALSDALPKLPPTGQIALLSALAERGDAGAANAVVALTTSANDDVKNAAWRALGSVGDATQINRLATAAAAEGPTAEAARDSLNRLKGAGINTALLTAFGKAGDAKVRGQLIRALSSRRSASSLPFFVTATGDDDASIRTEAINAVGNVGDMSALPVLLTAMQKTTDGGELAAQEKAARAIIDRSPKTDASATPLLAILKDARTGAPQRLSTLKLLGALGTTQAFDAVSMATKDANADNADAAIRALSDWPDDRAVPSLIEVAKSAAKPTQQILALRGVNRLLGPSKRPANEKIAFYQSGLAAAKRGEEKKLMIGGLSEIKTSESLHAIEPLLADEGLREEAAAAIVKIAKELNGEALKDARPALDKVTAGAKSADTLRDAKAALDRAK